MPDERKPVEALARGIRILEALSRSTSAMTNGQIARATGLPPSTVSRLTDSLVQLGYLRFTNSQGAYALTPKNLRLGYPVLAQASITNRAQRILDDLAARTGCTVALAVRDDLHVAFLATARGRDANSVNVAVGGRLPIATSAAGIALLGAMDEQLRARLTRSIRADLADRGLNSREFEETLDAAVRDPYVVLRGGWRADISGIATVVRSGDDLYGLTFIPRTVQMDDENVDRFIQVLRDAVNLLSD